MLTEGLRCTMPGMLGFRMFDCNSGSCFCRNCPRPFTTLLTLDVFTIGMFLMLCFCECGVLALTMPTYYIR